MVRRQRGLHTSTPLVRRQKQEVNSIFSLTTACPTSPVAHNVHSMIAYPNHIRQTTRPQRHPGSIFPKISSLGELMRTEPLLRKSVTAQLIRRRNTAENCYRRDRYPETDNPGLMTFCEHIIDQAAFQTSQGGELRVFYYHQQRLPDYLEIILRPTRAASSIYSGLNSWYEQLLGADVPTAIFSSSYAVFPRSALKCTEATARAKATWAIAALSPLRHPCTVPHASLHS